MLTPQQILDIIETMYPVIDELNAWITKDIAKRLMARIGRDEFFLTATDKWQLEVLQSAGGHLEAVKEELARWTDKADAEIARIFEDAGIRALEYDSVFYTEHGLEGFKLLKSGSMLPLLNDAYKQTKGTIHNFTQTTAEASQKRLIKALNTAYFKTASGAISYTQAVKDAVEDIATEQSIVEYPTGHKDSIETAVMRAVRTGVAQSSGRLAIEGMIERDWDVVLVSAHLGARYGDGGDNPSNHFGWQGKFYTRTGRTKGLPTFEESTGYGTGEGLCGWNCRHSFGPGDLRHNPYEHFSSEENKKAYDLSQKQRAMERKIRQDKQKLNAYQSAIKECKDDNARQELQERYDKTAERLSARNAEYNQYCEEHGLKLQNERIQIAKWDRAMAKKAIATDSAIKDFKAEILSAGGTSTGIPIQEVSTHLFTRANYRDISAKDIINALTSPLGLGKISGDGSQKFIGEFCTVPFNVDTGKVITCHDTSSRMVKKFKNG